MNVWKHRMQIAYKERQFWYLLVPSIIWTLIFCYYPMYGIYMAFVDYIPGIPMLQSPWVGLKNFRDFFSLASSYQVIRNTLVISGLNIVIGFPMPILFSLLINEIKSMKYKKTLQTMSYLPHFISWVVAASLAFSLFSTEGLLNDVLGALGLRENPVSYLGEGKYYWTIATGVGIWKSIGWSSIIYLSAMSAIDPDLYQAGDVDGLSRFGKVLYITIPTILPTIVFMWVFTVADLLNAGFEQHLLLGNIQTREYWDVLDTYAYRFGIQLGRYSFGVAVTFMKSLIGLVLVFSSNAFCKKLFKLSLF